MPPALSDLLTHSQPVVLSRKDLDLSEVIAVARFRAPVELSAEVRDIIHVGRSVVEHAIASDDPVYGLNTGLGARRDERLSADALLDYQQQIVFSHAGAVGDPLSDEDVRAAMFVRAVGIARGGAGASPPVLAGLVELINRGVHPLVPEFGSVGAADLGHLAAVAAVLIGGGRARVDGVVLSGGEALRRVGLTPLVLRPKDGLALISANAVSIGSGALVIGQADTTARLADLAGALTLEALRGNVSPFEPEVQLAKGLPGQLAVAADIRQLLRGSYLLGPGVAASLQDALSVRTIPQVHGAFREQITAACSAVEVELNGCNDNPLISPASGRALSNGNFHPMMMTLAFESLRVAIAHMGVLSERRIARLVTAQQGRKTAEQEVRQGCWRSEFTVPHILHNAVAALAAELRWLANPISLNSSPLGSGVEDHGTLAPQTVSFARTALDKLELILTVEILLAASLLSSYDTLPQLGAGTRPSYELATRLLREAGREQSAAEIVDRLRGYLTAETYPATERAELVDPALSRPSHIDTALGVAS